MFFLKESGKETLKCRGLATRFCGQPTVMQNTEAIKKAIRTVPNWPLEGINFRDVTTLFEKPAEFRQAVDLLAQWTRGNGYEVITGVDARGFLIAGVLAYQLGVPLVLARKKGKLPYETLTESYSLEYGTAEIEAHATGSVRGKRVLVVDDLLATGGTAMAAVRLMRRLGAAEVAFAAIINLIDLPGAALLNAEGVAYFTLVDFSETERGEWV